MAENVLSYFQFSDITAVLALVVSLTSLVIAERTKPRLGTNIASVTDDEGGNFIVFFNQGQPLYDVTVEQFRIVSKRKSILEKTHPKQSLLTNQPVPIEVEVEDASKTWFKVKGTAPEGRWKERQIWVPFPVTGDYSQNEIMLRYKIQRTRPLLVAATLAILRVPVGPFGRAKGGPLFIGNLIKNFKHRSTLRALKRAQRKSEL